MAAFIAKMDKQTYHNIKYLQQKLKVSDEKLLKYMSLELAKIVAKEYEKQQQTQQEAENGDQESNNESGTVSEVSESV